MENPRLSVLMCNYNHGPYVGEAIQAYLDQSRRADEIVVVDDASTDNSLEVLRPFAEAGHIRLISLEKNLGIIRAFARGLEEVKGEFLLSLAADDKCLPTFFERVLGLLEEHSQAPFAVGCVNDWFPDRLELPAHQKVTMQAMPESTYVTPEATFRLEQAYVPSGLIAYGAVFRTDLMRQIVPDLGNLGYLMDWFFMRVMAFRAGYCFLPEVVVHIRKLPGSLSSTAASQWSIRKKSCLEVMRLLDTPAYLDVKRQFRDSGALAVGGYRAVAMILRRPRYWEYVNGILLLKGLINFVTSLLPVRWNLTLRNLQGGWVSRRRG